MAGSIIYINDFCNQNCVFCCGKDKKTERSKYEQIIFNVKKKLVISGGEPILSKGLTYILKLAKKNKNIKYVELQSNGAILFYEKVIDKIEKHKVVTEYNINFPCFDKETDKIITRSDLFNYRIKGIKNLIDRDLNIRLTFVINKLNYKKMTEYLKLIYKKFSNKPSIQLSFIQIQGNAKFNDIAPTYKSIRAELMRSLEFIEKNKINCFTDNIPLCVSFPYNQNNIDYLKRRRGDFSFHEKKKLKSCKFCKLEEYCFGPPLDYIDLFGNGEFKAIK